MAVSCAAFSLCARNPVCLLDLDLQQEGMVWGFFFSGDRGTAGLQEIAKRYQRTIKEVKSGLLKESLRRKNYRLYSKIKLFSPLLLETDSDCSAAQSLSIFSSSRAHLTHL